jgi:hypothetical protein
VEVETTTEDAMAPSFLLFRDAFGTLSLALCVTVDLSCTTANSSTSSPSSGKTVGGDAADTATA